MQRRVQTRFMHQFQNLTPPLRERDFWALALARLTQTTFLITTIQNEEFRERSIAELLMIVSMPRVELGQVSIEGPLQHQYKISSPDVERYVQKFGIKGYLVGLSDERTIEQASPNYKSHQRTQVGASGISFQVADLFLWYYLREHQNDANPIQFDSQDERAVAKSRAIHEVGARTNP